MSATKKEGNTTNILNCFFQNKFTSWHIKLDVYICITKFTSHKQYLLGLPCSRNAKKTHTEQIIQQVFLLCLRRNVLQTSKVAASINFFPSIYVIGTGCFNEWLLLHLIIEKHDFLYKKSLRLYFLNKFYFWKCFLHSFCEYSTFFFINEVFKTQNFPGDILFIKSYY